MESLHFLSENLKLLKSMCGWLTFHRLERLVFCVITFVSSKAAILRGCEHSLIFCMTLRSKKLQQTVMPGVNLWWQQTSASSYALNGMRKDTLVEIMKLPVYFGSRSVHMPVGQSSRDVCSLMSMKRLSKISHGRLCWLHLVSSSDFVKEYSIFSFFLQC